MLKNQLQIWVTNFNTKKRKNEANNFEKDFFKLVINFVYSKTMENFFKKSVLDQITMTMRKII